MRVFPSGIRIPRLLELVYLEFRATARVGTLACHLSASEHLDKLDYSKEIAFGIFKPGCLDRACRGHTIDGFEVGCIVLFKHHPSGFEISNLRLNVVNCPAHLRMLAAGSTPGWKDKKPGAPATAVENPSWGFALRCQPQLFGVEFPGSS